MAQYRLDFRFDVGQGYISIGDSPGVLATSFRSILVDAGTDVTITINLEAFGYSAANWFDGVNGDTITHGVPYVYTMPNRDSTWVLTAIGTFTPANNYGLKYFHDWITKDSSDVDVTNRLEIYENEYTGASFDRQIKASQFRWGNDGQDLFDVLIGGSITVEVPETDTTNYSEFVTGDDRKFRVKEYRNGNLFFDGFISPSFREVPERTGSFISTYVAVDGLKGLSVKRCVKELFPLPQDLAINALCGALNQHFPEGRPVNVVAEIFETRMNANDGLFEQFKCGDNAFFEDGEAIIYENETRSYNQQLTIKEVIERIVNPFLCRVFLWDNEFYVIRTADLYRAVLPMYRYLSDGTFDSFTNVDNTDQSITCVDDGVRRTDIPFTEFTAILNLGILSREAQQNEFSSNFDNDDWIYLKGTTNRSSSIGPGNPILRYWNYVNAIPYDGNHNGDPSRVQFVTEEGTWARIWGTTDSSGFDDPTPSYITLQKKYSGEPLFMVKELANTFSVDFKWRHKKRGSGDANIPTNHYLAFMIKIGNNWLKDDDDGTFSWVQTENIMNYLIKVPSLTENEVVIKDVLVPEDGPMEIRLYCLINDGQTRDRYKIDYTDFNLRIEQNEALIRQSVNYKYVTDDTYSSKHPDYETYLGDSYTKLNESAIKLSDVVDEPVSELWSRDGVEELPLLSILLREMANLKGVNVIEVTGNALVDLSPFKKVIYDGKDWIIKSIRRMDNDRKYLVNMQAIGNTELEELTVNWEVIQSTGDDFIDGNMRIYVDDIQEVEEFFNNSGSFTVIQGQNIRVQYFYLSADGVAPGVTNPYLYVEIKRNGDQIFYEEHAITENEDLTRNHFFDAISGTYGIEVGTYDKPTT